MAHHGQKVEYEICSSRCFQWQTYFLSELFFKTTVKVSKWNTGITCSVNQKKVTLVWKIHEKALKYWVFPNFEGINGKNVFFVRAKIRPWEITFSLVAMVFWWVCKQKSYTQLYFWPNLLSHIWQNEPLWVKFVQ